MQAVKLKSMCINIAYCWIFLKVDSIFSKDIFDIPDNKNDLKYVAFQFWQDMNKVSTAAVFRFWKLLIELHKNMHYL